MDTQPKCQIFNPIPFNNREIKDFNLKSMSSSGPNLIFAAS